MGISFNLTVNRSMEHSVSRIKQGIRFKKLVNFPLSLQIIEAYSDAQGKYCHKISLRSRISISHARVFVCFENLSTSSILITGTIFAFPHRELFMLLIIFDAVFIGLSFYNNQFGAIGFISIAILFQWLIYRQRNQRICDLIIEAIKFTVLDDTT